MHYAYYFLKCKIRLYSATSWSSYPSEVNLMLSKTQREAYVPTFFKDSEKM